MIVEKCEGRTPLSVCPPQAGESRAVYFYFMTNIFNLSNIRKQYNKMLAVTAHHGRQKIKFQNTKSLFVEGGGPQSASHRRLLGQNWSFYKLHFTADHFHSVNLNKLNKMELQK